MRKINKIHIHIKTITKISQREKLDQQSGKKNQLVLIKLAKHGESPKELFGKACRRPETKIPRMATPILYGQAYKNVYNIY